MGNNNDRDPFDQKPRKDLSDYILDDSSNNDFFNDLSFNTEDGQKIDSKDIKICTDPASGFYNESDGNGDDFLGTDDDNLLNDLPFNTEDGQEIDSKDIKICTDPASGFFMKPEGDGTISGANSSESIRSGIHDIDDISSSISDGVSSGINDLSSDLSNIGSNASSGASRAGSFSKISNAHDLPIGVRSTLPKDGIEILSLTDDKMTKKGSKDKNIPNDDKRVKNSKSTTNKYVILLVTIGALLMVFYTTFAQPLGFNNKQKQLSENSYVSWDIRFTDMYQKRKVGSARELSAPSYNSTKANFYVALSNPGDEITYNLTIKNSGTLNAKVSSIYIMPENSEGDAILYFVDGISVGDYLDAGQSTNMTVTAKFNENAVSANRVIKNVSVIINYVQR